MDLLPRGLGDLVPSHQMPVSWIFIKLTYNVLPKDGLRAGWGGDMRRPGLRRDCHLGKEVGAGKEGRGAQPRAPGPGPTGSSRPSRRWAPRGLPGADGHTLVLSFPETRRGRAAPPVRKHVGRDPSATAQTYTRGTRDGSAL